MTERYNAGVVEAKWQAYWEQHGINRADIANAERPFFNLMMYPYPSAEGLHVGNVYAFTGADIYGRFKRLQGFDVFEPIGFDAFGIHSENFALEQGIHPMELIPRNIGNFTRQLKRMGFMYDWSRTVDVTQPEYYKWTQWIFLQLFKAGLAERRKAPVNWCPSCKTVLANEQVIDGRCERCTSEVTQRFLDQWFFKITQYAQRLLDNLEWIDWSSSTKRLQRNWIGRSEGADIDFPIVGQPDKTIRVFTTRPDTLFGATFMVLAPEHPLVEVVTTDACRAQVEKYVQEAAAMDLVERRKAGEERAKIGVNSGAKAINPANDEEIEIWIADYVLMEYGHGAVMAVPAHDERDFEFAKQYGLPIRTVVVPAESDANDSIEQENAFTAHTENEILTNSGQFDGVPAAQAIGEITAVSWRSITESMTGVFQDSAIGVHRSLSFIVIHAASYRYPKKIYRLYCPISKISDQMKAASAHWGARKIFMPSNVLHVAIPQGAKPTSPTRFLILPGTFYAIHRPSLMIARLIKNATKLGYLWTATSAVKNTPYCI
jgi:leucyl-tRNA synthetase